MHSDCADVMETATKEASRSRSDSRYLCDSTQQADDQARTTGIAESGLRNAGSGSEQSTHSAEYLRHGNDNKHNATNSGTQADDAQQNRLFSSN